MITKQDETQILDATSNYNSDMLKLVTKYYIEGISWRYENEDWSIEVLNFNNGKLQTISNLI